MTPVPGLCGGTTEPPWPELPFNRPFRLVLVICHLKITKPWDVYTSMLPRVNGRAGVCFEEISTAEEQLGPRTTTNCFRGQ